MRGFTLLEVMIALAIAAGVLLTVISSLNYHLSVIGEDRQETTAVLLGRAKLADPLLTQQAESKGTFADQKHPEVSWELELLPTEHELVKRVRLTVSWEAGKKKLTLVKYVAKQ
ncbi:prepilin-type N-terminal cleavage/methylation domain-containing protein [Geomesophilobacter sediminis]|uniref:Prepilin-type N-terminal cleavage/methylation domain-containing protein n=1 Tax=Geomesophilobacter sediminis TaxID=2798584 RepID=A0A8J7M0Z9_9BACT|nr:prepilin-type N-terminal cleavage/methylation domain-containing protein [Geomesophilobacter sediminis]MBJ6726632.1 prepilin-type N-terminal cleavage/methylation domain-containing protein [Geomesophilobacter sediminis]